MLYKLSRKEFDRFKQLLAAGWLRPNGVTAYKAAAQCGLSRSTWRRTLMALENKGWVTRYERHLPNRAKAHVYYLSIDARKWAKAVMELEQ